MKKLELRQIIREEIQKIFESNITTIKGFNLESDVAIAMLKILLKNSKFKTIIVPIAIDYYDGVRKNIVYTELINGIYKSKLINETFIQSVRKLIKSKKFDEIVSVNSISVVQELLGKILSKAILFELAENPNTFSKKVGSNKLTQAASKFSVMRGMQKFKNISSKVI